MGGGGGGKRWWWCIPNLLFYAHSTSRPFGGISICGMSPSLSFSVFHFDLSPFGIFYVAAAYEIGDGEKSREFL